MQKTGFSCAVVSDELDHNKHSVHTFLKKLIQDTISMNPVVADVNICK